MNGEYVISPTPNAPKGAKFNTNFADYPGGVEYFDVYMGPITHRYSEIFWTALPQTPVPPEIVKRFAGKGMAIVGYEEDQVRRKGDRDVDGSILQEDVSVPINMAYNHHHDLSLLGAGSRMEKIPYDPADLSISEMKRADPNFIYVPVQHTPSPLGLPTHVGLHEGNGGEYRKSYHGFASPVAYVVDSPRSVFVLPMQIDTWNREKMNISAARPPKFMPGPLPRASLPLCQFGGPPDTEPRGLTRDNEPENFFSTNMDDMSDAEKLKSPVIIGGVALIVAPFLVGCIALFASK